MQLRLATAALIAALVLTLAGCGVRGPLEPPPGTAVEPTPAGKAGKSKSTKPSKPFVLDGLL